MNLLRIILLFFAVYFARRIYQFYKFMKTQSQMIQEEKKKQAESVPGTIDAEYKVID